MAISILIKFPISTVQYEDNYMLGLEFDYNAVLESRINEDSAFVESGSTSACLIYYGTLNGDTIIQTDGRENIYDPIISSKLKFNLVSHNFPSWILEATDYYTDVRCVLAKCGEKQEWIEEWRGYFWGNTLNSRVVDDYIVTPLFAIDELSMSKYLKPYNTIGQYGKSRRLWNYFAYYKSFNDGYFGHIYTWMELNSSDDIFWDCPYCLHDTSNNEVYDFLSALHFDSYGYVYQDEDNDKLTWHDLFKDVCQYLGVTFMVGGRGPNPKDSYLIETAEFKTNNEFYTRVRHDNESVTATTTSSAGTWTTIVPNEKCNADFNITLEPRKYKGVKVKSSIKRYEAHEYLVDDNLDFVNENKCVLHRWGTTGHGNTIASYCVNGPMYHKMYYMKPTQKEEGYLQVKTENASASTEYNLLYLTNLGYIQANLDAQNYDYPKSADTLSYLLTKVGGSVIKLGEFEMREVTENDALTNYLILMNHKWFNAGWSSDDTSGLHGGAEDALTGNRMEAIEFKPFGNHEIRHNNEQHWLKIDYDMIVGNENIGNLDRLTSTSPYHQADMRGSEALAMPTTDSFYEYDNESNNYGSLVGSYYDGDPIEGYAPLMRWKMAIGQYELSERGNWVLPNVPNQIREYNIQHFADDMDKCVYAISASTDSYGYRFCPYYNTLKPKSGGGKKDMLVDTYSYGGPNSPMDGVMDLKILAPAICFDWKSGKIGYLNNVFYLLNNIKFSITDEAEIMGKSDDYEEMDVFDTQSKTKTIDEIEYKLSTPQYDGLFYNCFQYDKDANKLIANARKFYRQGNSSIGFSMEYWGVEKMANFVAPSPMTIDLTMRFAANTSDSYLFNNHVIIDDMTETPYTYQVREKTIYINRNLVKFKADRVFEDPWMEMTIAPINSGTTVTLPVNNNEYEQ